MNRFQKKCFIGSAGTHLLLVLILFVGPAFLSSKAKVDDLPPLDFIPSRLVDAAVSGGGNPQARPPVAVPTPPVPAPPVVNPTPPSVTPEKPPERKDQEPRETVKETPRTKVSESFEATKTPTRRVPNVSTRIIKPSSETRKTTRQTDTHQQDQSEATRRAIASALSQTARSLRDDLSPKTTVDTNFGPGGGGEAYANYAQVVKSVYQHAWVLPDTSADEAIVKVSVTIANDGRVVSSEIIRGSGDAAVDTSIQRTLERVTFVAPFPEGAKERQRTYPLSFSLKAKRMLG